ncbi:UDP-GlcNAc--UDP-phosphate GlcNAc-1-phosphate transferase [Fulvivirga sp. M361]|uniref:UDP-GlcNAc--UDP-phosphate GlcNAc-1-phosphate transferase n=1 Tax=Fulvivirga sp. M361 TaxID=2594266 RepID=UPI00117B7F65|nr:UDP-GlcNAc--UDP-phosphate GlcNAc-1-phosphate transferase [Fulvivirga sp. M361]TRX50239.1 UDP-GlcNAc--UDP-phosphate GlcNAc-1-phosphate transferase [Fulvivirga sp. M361]
MKTAEILVYFFAFVLLEWSYILVARRLRIIDKPNHRTMHSGQIVRGGGALFVLAYCAYFIYSDNDNYFFLIGLLLLAAISFIDDIRNLPGSFRLVFQVFSVVMMLYDVGIFEIWNWLFIISAIIIVTGVLNAFNFMDGINGITAGYSCSLLLILLIINEQLIKFADTNVIIFLLIGTLSFSVFNFRKRALCFAGDVGSITIGLIIAYLIINLIISSGSLLWILLLLIYGLDVVITIVQRIRNKENIFEPHRKHLFQVAINRLNVSHLLVSTIYSVAQFLIGLIVLLIYSFQTEHQLLWAIVLMISGAAFYLIIKTKITGSVWLSDSY